MNKLRSHLLPLSVNLALFYILYIAHYSGVFSIKIMNANPLTPLALLVAVCILEFYMSNFRKKYFGDKKFYKKIMSLFLQLI